MDETARPDILLTPESAPEDGGANSSVATGSSTHADVSPTESFPAGHGRATVRAVVAMLYYQGYTLAILGIAAPWIAQSFHLDQSGIAQMFAWISINALGALGLSHLADRVGRRRVLLWSLVGTPLFSIGAALSTRAAWFIVCEIGVYAFIGATFASAIVMLAEALPITERAKGQSYGGLARALGGGVCLILMPVLAHFGWSWRWLLLLPIAGFILLPFLARTLPESHRWEQAAASGSSDSHFYDIFSPFYRRRAIPLIIATLLGETAGVAVVSWAYFHAVSVVHLSATDASAIILIAGGVGLCGFPLGAWAAERFGRVRTITVLGCAVTLGTVPFFWGPPPHYAHPILWLGIANLWYSIMGNAVITAANSAVTELFPTALRGTIIGWLTLVVALSAIIAQVTIAALAARMGGLSVVAGYLALLSIPSALLWGLFIDETRGLSLEAAAGENRVATL
ncbi:MAG: MFS transporter [Candidatus Binataceae bacterium]